MLRQKLLQQCREGDVRICSPRPPNPTAPHPSLKHFLVEWKSRESSSSCQALKMKKKLSKQLCTVKINLTNWATRRKWRKSDKSKVKSKNDLYSHHLAIRTVSILVDNFYLHICISACVCACVYSIWFLLHKNGTALFCSLPILFHRTDRSFCIDIFPHF